MSWDGSGNFNRLFSWVADKAAGLNISSTRTDSDTDNITAVGFGNCLTRDGQGQPTANLPMAGFRHTGVQSGVSRSDYAAMNQVQDGLLNWTVAGGSSDAITVTYTPALAAFNDGQFCFFRAIAANATTAPTFAPNGLSAHPITRFGGSALAVGDIPGNLAEVILRYNVANTRWELMNPSLTSLVNATATTGTVAPTYENSAPSGWLLMDDGTFGSATSGSSNSNSAANQALFTLLFNNISDSNAPLLTSTGAGTTRAGQGTAAAAWAANCRMTLPRVLGRAISSAGSGSGLTNRSLGLWNVGEETHLLTLGETPTGITSSGTNSISVTSSVSTIQQGTTTQVAGGANFGVGTTFSSVTSTGSNGINVTSNNTGGGAHNNMQPSTFLFMKIKQ